MIPSPGLAAPLAGVSKVPHLDVVLPAQESHASVDAYCWGLIAANVAALATAYDGAAGPKIVDRLNAILQAAHHELVALAGPVAARKTVNTGKLAGAAAQGLAGVEDEGIVLLPGWVEANWWLGAIQGATALSVWAGLKATSHHDEEVLSLSRSLRAGVILTFGDKTASEMFERSIAGDGEAWINWVVGVHAERGGGPIL